MTNNTHKGVEEIVEEFWETIHPEGSETLYDLVGALLGDEWRDVINDSLDSLISQAKIEELKDNLNEMETLIEEGESVEAVLKGWENRLQSLKQSDEQTTQ